MWLNASMAMRPTTRTRRGRRFTNVAIKSKTSADGCPPTLVRLMHGFKDTPLSRTRNELHTPLTVRTRLTVICPIWGRAQ